MSFDGVFVGIEAEVRKVVGSEVMGFYREFPAALHEIDESGIYVELVECLKSDTQPMTPDESFSLGGEWSKGGYDPTPTEMDFDCRFEMSVVVRLGPGTRRLVAPNLASQIALRLQGSRFGVETCGPADVVGLWDARFDPRFSGAEIWTVEWRQRIRVRRELEAESHPLTEIIARGEHARA